MGEQHLKEKKNVSTPSVKDSHTLQTLSSMYLTIIHTSHAVSRLTITFTNNTLHKVGTNLCILLAGLSSFHPPP